MKQLKFGLTAYGMSGYVFHAPLITDTEGCLLVGAVQRPKAWRLKSVQDYGADKIAFPSLDALLASDVEVVVVNTPQEHHYQEGLAALEAGKHIILEKPATLRASELADLYLKAEAKGLSVIVFQNRRWDADYLTLHKVVSSGVLGQVVQYDATFNRWRNYIEQNTWKEVPSEGNGLLYNLGPHLIDQAIYLLGTPTSVFAILKAERPGSHVIDAFQITLEFANGATASLRSSYLVRESVPKFAVHGTKGSFLKYGLDGQEALLKAGWLPSQRPDWGLEPEQDWATLNAEKDGEPFRVAVPSIPGDYKAFYKGVYNHLVNHAAPPVDKLAPLKTIEVIEACYRSNALGQKVKL